MATLRRPKNNRTPKKQKEEIKNLINKLFNGIESISNEKIYIWKDGYGLWNNLMTLIGQNLRYRQIEIVFQNNYIKLKYYRIINGYQEERGFINFSDIRSSEIKLENEIYTLYINAYDREYSFCLESPQFGYQINDIIKLYLTIYNMHKKTNSKTICNLLFYQYEKKKYTNKLENLEQFLYAN